MEIQQFISEHLRLLDLERQTEAEESRLLISNCPESLLERQGLALGSLGVVNISLGLGGKTLVELERPLAWHAEQDFSSHSFRPGDLACISEQSSSGRKVNKNVSSNGKESKIGVEGVVFRVSTQRIILAVGGRDGTQEDTEVNLPERCRV